MASLKERPRTLTKKSMVLPASSLGPAPVAVFEDQAGKAGNSKFPASFSTRRGSVFGARAAAGHAGGADLLSGPAVGGVGHGSLAFSEG